MHRHRQKQKLRYSSPKTELMPRLKSPKFSITVKKGRDKITAKPLPVPSAEA